GVREGQPAPVAGDKAAERGCFWFVEGSAGIVSLQTTNDAAVRASNSDLGSVASLGISTASEYFSAPGQAGATAIPGLGDEARSWCSGSCGVDVLSGSVFFTVQSGVDGVDDARIAHDLAALALTRLH